MSRRVGLERSPVVPQMANADDTALVAGVRAGDAQAFDALVVAYWASLRNFVTPFAGSQAAAEEVVQDLFLKIWRMRTDWAVSSSLRSYLFRAARNAALLHYRRTRVVARWESGVRERQEVPAMGLPAVSAEQQVENLELRGRLRLVIARLPERCRQVAELRLLHDLSPVEIAHVMGITVKAVERQLTKALKVLRVEMVSYLKR